MSQKQVNIYNEAGKGETLLPVVNDTGSFGAILLMVVFVVIPELWSYL